MTTRAIADAKYMRKYIILMIAGLGFAGWGFYDATYAYPKKLEMAEAFDQIKDQEDAIHQWARLYHENKDRGWHQEKPHDSAETVRSNIRFSYCFGAAGTALMLFFLYKFLSTKSSWMESTETGITTSWGQSLEFDKINKINKKRWEAKGIAKVSYDDNGVSQVMVFDDFKYEREAMGELMTLCEQHLSAEQIVGGKSQAEIKAEADQSDGGGADFESDSDSDSSDSLSGDETATEDAPHSGGRP